MFRVQEKQKPVNHFFCFTNTPDEICESIMFSKVMVFNVPDELIGVNGEMFVCYFELFKQHRHMLHTLKNALPNVEIDQDVKYCDWFNSKMIERYVGFRDMEDFVMWCMLKKKDNKTLERKEQQNKIDMVEDKLACLEEQFYSLVKTIWSRKRRHEETEAGPSRKSARLEIENPHEDPNEHECDDERVDDNDNDTECQDECEDEYKMIVKIQRSKIDISERLNKEWERRRNMRKRTRSGNKGISTNTSRAELSSSSRCSQMMETEGQGFGFRVCDTDTANENVESDMTNESNVGKNNSEIDDRETEGPVCKKRKVCSDRFLDYMDENRFLFILKNARDSTRNRRNDTTTDCSQEMSSVRANTTVQDGTVGTSMERQTDEGDESTRELSQLETSCRSDPNEPCKESSSLSQQQSFATPSFDRMQSNDCQLTSTQNLTDETLHVPSQLETLSPITQFRFPWQNTKGTSFVKSNNEMCVKKKHADVRLSQLMGFDQFVANDKVVDTESQDGQEPTNVSLEHGYLLNHLELNDLEMTEEEAIGMNRNLQSDSSNDGCESTTSIDGNRENEESEPNEEMHVNVGNEHMLTTER